MRIGIDARFYSSHFTGIGRYVYELIDQILKIDQENEYVLFFNEPYFKTYQPPHRGVEKILAKAPHYSLAEQTTLWRKLENAHLDLVHFTHFNAPILYRKPSVVTIHDLTLNIYPGNKMNSWLQRRAYEFTIRSIARRAKKVIAVSEHTKRDVVKILTMPSKRIVVIHEGVNEKFHQIKDRHLVENFKQKSSLVKPYLLYAGVWRSHKNLVNLIKAFAILKHRYHFDGWLVITGKEDPWYPEVREAVAEEKLEGEIRFTGLVPDEDLVLLYNGASIYVFPSLYEGFGLPALEAFACGLPVCAADSSSLPEICGEGNAVFFNPRDPADIAAKIASVYNDPEKMKELAARGLQRLKDFSWEKMARETLKVYENAISAPTR